jgi:hypothetical protein
MTKWIPLVGVVLLAGLGMYGYRARSALTRSRGLPDLPGLQAAYASAANMGERSDILHRTATLDDPAVASWLAGIAEREPALANQASTVLGAMSNTAAGGELLEIATGTAPTLVRANAVRALGKCGGPREAAALVTTLEDPGQPLRIRQEAALALGTLGDRSAIPELIATIESARDDTPDAEQLRISAVQSLGKMGSPESHEFLSRYAQRALSPTERAFVTRAASASR